MFKVFYIVVGILFDLVLRKLKFFVNGKVDIVVGNDNVVLFGKGWDDGRNESEWLGVDDGGFGIKKFGYMCFKLLVYV